MQNALGRPRNHRLFIGMDHSRRDLGRMDGDDGFILRIAVIVQDKSEVSKAIVDALTDHRRVLANSTGEDDCVETAEGRSKSANRFLDLIAVQRHGLRSAHVARFASEQIAHVRTGLRHAQQPGFVIHHAMELLDAHLLGPREVPRKAGIKVSGARAHGNAGRWRERHRRVNAPALQYCGEARSIAKMSKDDASTRCVGACNAFELFHEKRIGKAMKAEAPDAFLVEATRDRQELRDARHVAMERRVEARHLRNIPKAPAKRSIRSISPEMLWAVRADPSKHLHEFIADPCRRAVLRAAVRHTMSNCLDCREETRLFKPCD